jgi:hypothetical protein
LLIFYPLIYYITFAFDRYHHPIEPELIILAVWAVMPRNKQDADALPAG